MGNLDELYDIYQSFLDSVSGDFDYLDTVKRDDTGKERALLAFSNGFNVELANKQDVENSATGGMQRKTLLKSKLLTSCSRNLTVANQFETSHLRCLISI